MALDSVVVPKTLQGLLTNLCILKATNKDISTGDGCRGGLNRFGAHTCTCFNAQPTEVALLEGVAGLVGVGEIQPWWRKYVTEGAGFEDSMLQLLPVWKEESLLLAPSGSRCKTLGNSSIHVCFRAEMFPVMVIMD